MPSNKTILVAMLIAVISCPAVQAWAVTRSMQARVAFVTPVNLAVVSQPEWHEEQPGKAAGTITLAGAKDQAVSIRTDNYRAGRGIMPAQGVCSYGALPAMPCNDVALSAAPAAGTGTRLAVGLAVSALPGQAGDTAAPGFDVIVVYN